MPRLGKALLPLAWRYVSKRMPPEEEAAWRQAERRGQGYEWLKGKMRKRRLLLSYDDFDILFLKCAYDIGFIRLNRALQPGLKLAGSP